ncbi:hypothetical protein KFZ70_08135 [Tamlana fucoidanivorans]|uniref:Tetratricopeptide repeat protein n=1 Tax=Allotamlana fucoidanivorans TaxID=2583814 RepID=A0A5C4SIR6_9FLAO|nr:hypothetical protein [Tamlana fucoidanivorans]TNJ43710.1 hypothetical protein FGF67_10070 [Tamlana fucoidanivorans]
MNTTDFTHILQQPQNLTFEQIEDVKSIIDTFPYFQAARAIYLKGLQNQGSIKYNQELKTTAAYTADRSILFDFITSEAFIQNEISEFIKKNTAYLKNIDVDAEDISVDKSVGVDEALQEQIKETVGVLDPSLFETKTDSPSSAEDIKTVEENKETLKAEDVLELGKPFNFNKNESHSFNEWLKLTKLKPLERPFKGTPKPAVNVIKKIEEPQPKKNKKTTSEKERKFELIDKFISKNPKINPTKSAAPKGNLAKAQMIQPEALMTETLARIYVEQKNFKKAIQSYKILSLKYPEKSGFFANQIKAVEQLQEKNNKE